MKTVKWHKGVINMISKRDAKADIMTITAGQGLVASKSNFTLLATRAGIGGWKDAVNAVVSKNDREFAIKNLQNNENFCLNKTELRRAADLV